MHSVTKAKYLSGYKLLLTFEDGSIRAVDLEPYLGGEVFQPLKDLRYFKKVRVNTDLDTIVWPNEADFCPDFLYEIGVPQAKRVLASWSVPTGATRHLCPSILRAWCPLDCAMKTLELSKVRGGLEAEWGILRRCRRRLTRMLPTFSPSSALASCAKGSEELAEASRENRRITT